MKRITCIILALTLTLLCGCGSKDSGDNVQEQEEFVVTPMASGLELEPYSCADFSMSIPPGLDGGGSHVQRRDVPRFACV